MSFASVVHINEKGGSFGGTEEYIALVTAALGGRGVRSSLVCGVVTGTLPVGLDEVRIVPGLAQRRPRPGTAAAVAAIIADLDADVVYLHNLFDPAVVAAIAALPRRGVVLWYVHDHYPTCLSELRWRRDVGSCPERLGHSCLRAIEHGRCVMRRPVQVHVGTDVDRRVALSRSMEDADGLIVVSEYMRSLLAAAEPRLDRDLHVLSRPIREIGPPRRRRRATAAAPAVVTYAGRINTEKGLAVVIEALGATRSSAPVELRIAGVVEDEQYWADCRQRLAALVDSGITATYLGHLDYDATDELFRRSDIVAVPSLWPEPLGAVALEAMAAGAAVVASPVGGLADVVVPGRNGLHAAAGDVAAWTGALTTLLDDPETADRLGRQARSDVTVTGIGDHVRDLDTLVTAYRGSDHPRTAPRPPRQLTPRAPTRWRGLAGSAIESDGGACNTRVVLLAGINHVAVLTGDTARFLDFYGGVFGATHEVLQEQDGFTLTVVCVGPTSELNVFELRGNSEHERQVPMFGRGRLDHLALEAASIDAFDTIRERLLACGATDGFVTDFGPVLSLFFRDPDGLEAEVCVRNPDARPGVHHPPGTPATRYHPTGDAPSDAPPGP